MTTCSGKDRTDRHSITFNRPQFPKIQYFANFIPFNSDLKYMQLELFKFQKYTGFANNAVFLLLCVCGILEKAHYLDLGILCVYIQSATVVIISGFLHARLTPINHHHISRIISTAKRCSYIHPTQRSNPSHPTHPLIALELENP